MKNQIDSNFDTLRRPAQSHNSLIEQNIGISSEIGSSPGEKKTDAKLMRK